MISIPAERLLHAVLLSGGTAEAKQTYALHTAKKLLCENNQGCEKCRSCLWVEKLSHPDLLLLPSDEVIKIDEIRLVSHHLHQTSHQGKSKIVLLSKADYMPLGAVNALLKTLEEPPPQCYIFLFSDYPYLLPATLRSRCQKIYFPTLKKSSPELISALIDTLKALKKGTISVFESADQWKNHPMMELLDGLYYCLLESKSWGKPLFIWQDYLNNVRRQVLNKQHPNHLLALEHLFYQWIVL